MNVLYLNFPSLLRLFSTFSITKTSVKLFTIKVGLASAAVYYVKEQGVWKNSNESIKTYEKLKETIKPYAQDLKAQIPIELPELPESKRLSSLAKHGWNTGVLTTFKYISELPEIVSTWTNKGIEKALENKDIKEFVDSFSSKKPIEQK